MSNLFFKSESVKNSVKSGLNFVSNRVFKAFLLMSMMLLSWNGWGQGYTIIYPEGKTVAEPGDVVTVVFNEDISKFVYADDKETIENYEVNDSLNSKIGDAIEIARILCVVFICILSVFAYIAATNKIASNALLPIVTAPAAAHRLNRIFLKSYKKII